MAPARKRHGAPTDKVADIPTDVEPAASRAALPPMNAVLLRLRDFILDRVPCESIRCCLLTSEARRRPKSSRVPRTVDRQGDLGMMFHASSSPPTMGLASARNTRSRSGSLAPTGTAMAVEGLHPRRGRSLDRTRRVWKCRIVCNEGAPPCHVLSRGRFSSMG